MKITVTANAESSTTVSNEDGTIAITFYNGEDFSEEWGCLNRHQKLDK